MLAGTTSRIAVNSAAVALLASCSRRFVAAVVMIVAPVPNLQIVTSSLAGVLPGTCRHPKQWRGGYPERWVAHLAHLEVTATAG